MAELSARFTHVTLLVAMLTNKKNARVATCGCIFNWRHCYDHRLVDLCEEFASVVAGSEVTTWWSLTSCWNGRTSVKLAITTWRSVVTTNLSWSSSEIRGVSRERMDADILRNLVSRPLRTYKMRSSMDTARSIRVCS
ncbi:hypothetical protein EUGRSUZ_L00741 [Eucalyptus grandis]|uniref:Uncharacterized protein n=2 Tax=Eucalyptus grandis TaxID=71139 RepID=A0A058ZUR7_EUCGR|nr:hypothetical protein EUGRSUZ_L00741 [Eucalyptus grandis]